MKKYQRRSADLFSRLIRRFRERKGIFVEARTRDVLTIDRGEIGAEKDPLRVNKVRWASGSTNTTGRR